MNIENIKSDRDAIEIAIKNLLKPFTDKYQLKEVSVYVTSVHIGNDPRINSFDVKINVSI